MCSLIPEDRLGGSGGGWLGDLAGEGVKESREAIVDVSDIVKVGRLAGVNLGSWRLSEWESLGRLAVKERIPGGAPAAVGVGQRMVSVTDTNNGRLWGSAPTQVEWAKAV